MSSWISDTFTVFDGILATLVSEDTAVALVGVYRLKNDAVGDASSMDPDANSANSQLSVFFLGL